MDDVYSQSAALIAQFEGFRDHAYWDVNHWRVGYGSDTLGAGQAPVTKTSHETRQGGMANLRMRVRQFYARAESSCGEAHWGALPTAARAALVSMTYNYGTLPEGVAAAVRHDPGDLDAIAHAVERHASDNGGVNSSRRRTEAAQIRGA